MDIEKLELNINKLNNEQISRPTLDVNISRIAERHANIREQLLLIIIIQHFIDTILLQAQPNPC